MKFRIGITGKLVFTIIAMVILLMIIAGYYSFNYQKELLLSQFDDRARVMLNSLAVSSEYPLLAGNKEALNSIGNAILKQQDVAVCEIKDSSGRTLFRSSSKKNITNIRSYTAFVTTERFAVSPDEMLFLDRSAQEMRFEKIGEVSLSFSVNTLMQRMGRQAKGIILLTLVGILLIFLSVMFLVRLILGRPVDELIEGIRALASGDLNYKVPVRTRDEIGELAASFNKMSEDLKESTVSIDVLAKEQKRFQDVTLSIGDWIWEVDGQGRYTYSSSVAERILGYKSEEIIGKYFYDFFHPDEREKLKRQVFEVFAKRGTLNGFVNRNTKKDGQVVILETSGVPLVDADAKLLGYRGADRDVTERKRYEERLATVNSCLLGFGADPVKNIQNLTIICGEILDGVCSLYNRLEDGLLCSRGQWNAPSDYNPVDRPDGHICYDVIKEGGDHALIVRNLPQTLYAQIDPNVIKYQLQTYIGMVVKCGGNPIGAICVVYQNDFIPSEEDKEFLGIIASAIGVEEGRKRAEDQLKIAYEQLKQTQAQLVQSAKMSGIGSLASGVAHEINNPLTAVLNNVQLIKMIAEQKKEFNIDDFKELLTTIEDSALRCKRITQALLDFSRAAGISFQPFSLNDAVEKVTSLIEHELRLQNIAIQKQLAVNLPLISANPQLFQQAVFDILNNAKWAIQQKGAKDGGTITIRTEYQPKDKTARIYISDTGIGMPEENLQRIFEPFFTTKPLGEGTGLGLSIVYSIIKEHKGTIEAESKVGEGTTFKIRLPIIQA